MCLLDASLADLVKNRVITREEALTHADDPEPVRGLNARVAPGIGHGQNRRAVPLSEGQQGVRPPSGGGPGAAHPRARRAGARGRAGRCCTTTSCLRSSGRSRARPSGKTTWAAATSISPTASRGSPASAPTTCARRTAAARSSASFPRRSCRSRSSTCRRRSKGSPTSSRGSCWSPAPPARASRRRSRRSSTGSTRSTRSTS